MVALRSSGRDRVPLVAVWVLTLAVVAVGIAARSPIMLLWGALGIPGAAFLTRIHLRDTGRRRDAPAPAAPPAPPPASAPPLASATASSAAGEVPVAGRAAEAEAEAGAVEVRAVEPGGTEGGTTR
jgi:hypothetical protein